LQASGAELSIVHRAAQPDAPFDDRDLTLGLPATSWDGRPDEDQILAGFGRFRPHAVLIVSWDVGAYRRVARTFRGQALRILCMDNPWLGTAKQWAGRAVAPWVIRPVYDAAFLPGERQAAFARRLGFDDDRIFEGLYCCDYDRFAAVRPAAGVPKARAFVFSGRLVKEKGVDVLADAYRVYRRAVPEPWPLVVAGTGPLAPLVADITGVEMLGFVPPPQLPSTFARASCLLLPSRFEPWGVVVHEAAAAGLAVICTAACGASTRFVDDGRNGCVVPTEDPEALAGAMVCLTGASDDQLDTMARASIDLASVLTPSRWATNLTERLEGFRSDLRLPEP